MTTKLRMMSGTLVVMISATGCTRDQPATTPAAQSPAMPDVESEPAEAVVELPPLNLPAPSNEPGAIQQVTAEADSATDEGPQDEIAVDLKRLVDPGTTPEEWEAVQNEMLQGGAAAVPGLAAGLKSKDPSVREMAATLLAVVSEGLEQAEPSLREALQDESAYVRANAATALCRLPGTEEAVIPVLAELLERSDPNLRQIAATNLENFGPEAAPFVERFATSLDDDRADVLMPILELLGRIGPPAEAAAPKLRQIVFEQTGDVQAAATAALQQIETPSEQR